MLKLLQSDIGRLRVVGMMEGISLLALIFFAMPLKYMFQRPEAVRIIGSIHGALFLIFIVLTMMVALQHNWVHRKTTWKVLLSSFIPFGTFYIDRTILSKMM